MWKAAVRRLAHGIALASWAACSLPMGTCAQVIERHLPQALGSDANGTELAEPAVPEEDSDDRPLGPALSAILIVSGASPLPVDGERHGVDLGDFRILNTRNVRMRLQRFLGQPVSKKLISEIRIAIIHPAFPR